MKITAENYEQWALDYLEGTLSAEQRVSFEHFLEGNARAADEIRRLQEFMPVVQAESVVFPEPALLKRAGRVTPLRRLLSLVSGAAAAAVIAGGFMFLGRSGSTMQALEASATSDPESEWMAEAVVPARPEAVVAEETPAPTSSIAVVAPADVVSANVSPASEGVSRVARWNRKTAERLERMEARQERRTTQARLLAEATFESPVTDRIPEPSLAETSEALSGLSDRREPQAAVRPEEPERAAYEILTAESLIEPEVQPSEELPIETWAASSTETLYLSEQGSLETAMEKQTWDSRRDKKFLRALLGPLEKISPIKYYENEEGRGVEIASILRIGSRAD